MANLKDLYLFVSIPVCILPLLSRALEITIYGVYNEKDSFCHLDLLGVCECTHACMRA